MKHTLRTRWFIDAALFTGFLAAFFLDFTGLDLHQWIGIAAGGLAAYHLATHWSWVRTVTERIFGATAPQARLYYLLDGLIFSGFLLIGVTGLVISTWLNLAVTDYPLWLAVHIQASVATLALTVVKIALHGRWVVLTARRIFTSPARQSLCRPLAPSLAAVPVDCSRQMGRRDFLKLMGIVGAGSFFAMLNAAEGLQAAALPESSETEVASLSEASEAEGSSSLLVEATGEAATAEPASQVQACSVRCNRGCAFPGHCHRYTDSNGNGLCDYGECL